MNVGVVNDYGDQIIINNATNANVYYQRACGEFDDWSHTASYSITRQREILRLFQNDSTQSKALHLTRVELELQNACPVLELTLSRRSRHGHMELREALYAGLMLLRALESQQSRGLSPNGAQSKEYLDRVISFSVDQEIGAILPALCPHSPIISPNLSHPLNPSSRSSWRKNPILSVNQLLFSSRNCLLIRFVSPPERSYLSLSEIQLLSSSSTLLTSVTIEFWWPSSLRLLLPRGNHGHLGSSSQAGPTNTSDRYSKWKQLNPSLIPYPCTTSLPTRTFACFIVKCLGTSMLGTGIWICVRFRHRGQHTKISVCSWITRQVFLTSPPLLLHLSMTGATCHTSSYKKFWNTTTDLTPFTPTFFQLPHTTRISTRSLVHSCFLCVHYPLNHWQLYSDSIQHALCTRWKVFSPFSSSLRTMITPFDQSIPHFETSSRHWSVRIICTFVLRSDTLTLPLTVYESSASLTAARFLIPNAVHCVTPVACGFVICTVLWERRCWMTHSSPFW